MGFTLLHTCCKTDRDWIKGLEKETLLLSKCWFPDSMKKLESGGDLLAHTSSLFCGYGRTDPKHHNALFKCIYPL